MRKRQAIPTELKDKLLVECGYKCSVPNCNVAQSLEFHHVDSDPSNNQKNNIVVLCAVHHHQADTNRISRRSLNLMKGLLLDVDGTLSMSKHCDRINISMKEFQEFIEIVRLMSKSSLRLLSRAFIRALVGFDGGYRCRSGLEYHDFLLSKNLVVEEKTKALSLFKISEKGKLLCKFLYTSQYNLPNIYFEDVISLDDIQDIYSRTDNVHHVCFGHFAGRVCASCGKMLTKIDGAKTCEKGHLICSVCLRDRNTCPLCKQEIK
jgi:hypothetical protein